MFIFALLFTFLAFAITRAMHEAVFPLLHFGFIAAIAWQKLEDFEARQQRHLS